MPGLPNAVQDLQQVVATLRCSLPPEPAQPSAPAARPSAPAVAKVTGPVMYGLISDMVLINVRSD